MAAPHPLLRCLPLLRLRLHFRYQNIAAGVFASLRHPTCSFASESISSDCDVMKQANELLRIKNSPKLFSKIDDPEYRKWKDKEDEILRDIEPTSLFAKEILHSDRYMDGERLTTDDERYVWEKLLAYHPRSADKIGCGLDSIMVDRHPQYKHSRCLFVVRTDGGWIDFSYQKCLRQYIRKKYPSYAERFIREHFKRSN
ncbi:hypothetical protein RND81_01G096400 [Saponaria officinalis]|uniref:DCL protein n=1 Tax=Saponaria officinalis TaxID=3572 RepID=A0AAW1NDZ9_SAPOF